MEIKPIPFLEGYYATTDGDVLDDQKERLHQSLDTRGYLTVFIDGKNRIVHDLILKTFEPIPDYLTGKVMANHFDLIKTNNKLSNLDWVNDKWNNIHWVLMRNKNPDRPHLKITSVEEVRVFNTLKELADFFAVDMRTCWLHLKEGKELAGFKLTYVNHRDPIVVKHQSGLGVSRYPDEYGKMTSSSRPIKVFNLKTKEIIEYPTMLAAANVFGCLVTHVRNRLSTPGKPRVFNREFVMVDSRHDFDFLTPTVIETLLSRGAKKVVVFDGCAMTFSTYVSASRFILKHCRYVNAKKSITTELKKKGMACFKEYVVVYLPEAEEHNPDLYLILKFIGFK